MTLERGVVVLLVGAVAAVVLSGCIAEAPPSIGISHYRSVALRGDPDVQAALRTAPVRLWFERSRDELDMIAVSPVNVYTVPVRFDGVSIVPDQGRIRGTAEGCAGAGRSCTVEGWFSNFVTERLAYSTTGQLLTLRGGTVTLQLQRL